MTQVPLVSAGDALSALSRVVVATHHRDQLAQQVAELAVVAIPGATGASVTLVSGGAIHAAAFAGAGIIALDERLGALGSGPALHAARTGTLVGLRETANSPLYPLYAAAAAEVGITSVLCIGLPVAGRAIGALTLSCTGRPHELASGSITLATVFARYAAVALASAARCDDARSELKQRCAAPAPRATVDLTEDVVTRDHVDLQDAIT